MCSLKERLGSKKTPSRILDFSRILSASASEWILKKVNILCFSIMLFPSSLDKRPSHFVHHHNLSSPAKHPHAVRHLNRFPTTAEDKLLASVFQLNSSIYSTAAQKAQASRFTFLLRNVTSRKDDVDDDEVGYDYYDYLTVGFCLSKISLLRHSSLCHV